MGVIEYGYYNLIWPRKLQLARQMTLMCQVVKHKGPHERLIPLVAAGTHPLFPISMRF
jgi:hypothetical protein